MSKIAFIGGGSAKFIRELAVDLFSFKDLEVCFEQIKEIWRLDDLLRHGFAVLLTVACLAQSGISAGAEPVRHEGLEGVWLRNDSAEVFVTGNPYPRIAAFRLRGGDSPMHLAAGTPFFGIRVWFMEPVQNAQSMLPARQSAVIERLGERGARLVAAPEETSGLQLVMEVALDPRRPVLRLRHGFKNLRGKDRRLALWSIMVFPHRGVGLTPWGVGGENFRSCVVFGRTEGNDPCLRLGQQAMAIDFRRPARSGRLKVGAVSDAGWAAYLWPGGVLHSRVAYVPGATYPEGGASITFYSAGKTADSGFCEVEHVGPLSQVGPGETAWMSQELQLLPAVDLTGDDADRWMERLDDSELNGIAIDGKSVESSGWRNPCAVGLPDFNVTAELEELREELQRELARQD